MWCVLRTEATGEPGIRAWILRSLHGTGESLVHILKVV